MTEVHFFSHQIKSTVSISEAIFEADISAGELAACLDLSFHLCVNLFTLSAVCCRTHPTPPACAGWISSVYSFSFRRRYLKDGKQTLTICSRLQIHQFIPSSIISLHFKRADPLLLLYVVFFISNATHGCFLLTSFPLSVSFVLYPSLHISTPTDNIAICLVIHPSSNAFPTWTVHFSPLCKQDAFLSRFPFSPSVANILFSAPSGKISRAFTPLPTLPSLSLCLILFYILSSRPETEPSYQAEATAADVARPQTSASHVPPQLYSADQTNRWYSLNLAVVPAVVQLAGPGTITAENAVNMPSVQWISKSRCQRNLFLINLAFFSVQKIKVTRFQKQKLAILIR